MSCDSKVLAKSVASDVKPLKRKEPRYTPLSKRQDRPDAIAWLLRNHPELKDAALRYLFVKHGGQAPRPAPAKPVEVESKSTNDDGKKPK